MKKTVNKLTSLLIAMLLIIFSSAIVSGASETKYTSGYYTYTVSNGKAEITDFDDTVGGSITIPSTLGGYPVTSIGGFAFYLCDSLTGITIPNGVTSVGDVAFYGCSSLTKITIPNGVTSIGSKAFSGCSSLTSITIPSSITSISSEMFYRCTSLASVTIPTGVTSIGNHAFSYCYGLVKLTIPNSVTNIGEMAFQNCSGLTSVTIPDSVVSIGAGAFSGCSKLAKVTLPEGLLSLGNTAFYNCSSLTKITIPQNITSINDSAFLGCSSLTSVSILGEVLSIGNSAFSGCSGLTRITIPDSVLSMGDYAFSSCDSLTSIVIHNSITSIGDYAFNGCSKLTDVYYTGSSEEWSDIFIGDYNEDLLNATIHFNYNPNHSHSYSSKTTKSATCNQTGIKTYTCSCGDSYTETIPATGNHSAGSWQIISNPTTEKDGKKIKKCTSCGVTVSEESIPKLSGNNSYNDVVMTPSQTIIRYGDSIILHANIENIPSNSTIEWSASNSNFAMDVSSNGKTCKITPKSSGDTTFTVTIYDENGNVISAETQEMESKAGFFDKIIAFFKGIFGLNKTYSDTLKTI